MKNKIVIYSSLSKTLELLILGSAIMMMGGFLLDSANLLIQILGFLNGLLGLICVVFGFLALLHIQPKITLSELGIKDNRILKDLVAWNEIEEVKLIYENKQNKLLILLKEELDYSNLAFLHRCFKSKKSCSMNKQLKVNLSQSEVNYAELIDFLKEQNCNTK